MRALWCVCLFVFAEAHNEGRMNVDDFIGLAKPVEATSEPILEPVPFGHINIEGFGDPYSPIKQPLDKLELSFRTPKTREEALQLLKTDRSKILFVNPYIKKYFATQKEDMLGEKIEYPPPVGNGSELKWSDLTSINKAKRVMMPTRNVAQRKSRPIQPYTGEKAKYFAPNSFDIIQDRTHSPVNWTTCDQFAVKAIFSPIDIVNMKWTPFYIWTDMGIATSMEHTFEYPTIKVINEYYSTYTQFLNKTIDWSQPKLLMRGMGEMLLIAADRRGLFDAIFKQEIPESAKNLPIKLPRFSLRIKIEDPYLALTYCENHYATLMAVSGNEPTNSVEMEAEAATINFNGIGRPIWRDIRAEKDNERRQNEAKAEAERDKFINIDGPLPPTFDHWDTDKVH